MQKIVLIPLVIALLAGCSSGTDSGSETGTTGEEEQKPAALTEPVDEGEAWLAENARQQGVVVTDSGLQYRVIHSGEGASPGLTDKVVTHYQGTFIDGKVFDSSIKRGRPAEFPVNGVIKAWTEALLMMKEGDKWQLFVPPELGYGEKGAGTIPGNTVLIFEVELIEVKAG